MPRPIDPTRENTVQIVLNRDLYLDLKQRMLLLNLHWDECADEAFSMWLAIKLEAAQKQQNKANARDALISAVTNQAIKKVAGRR